METLIQKYSSYGLLRTLKDLIDFFGLENLKNSPFFYITTEEYKKHFTEIHQQFRFQVTKYYLGLANIQNPNCPILLQILPSVQEIIDPFFKETDPQKEEENSPIEGLIHSYPDRVLWYVTHNCAVYCRFCFRKRKVSRSESNFFSLNYKKIIHYIKNTRNIKEVILSGGDPLSLPDQTIEKILKDLKSINHLCSIRIHTRMITTYPYRITKKLCRILKQFYPLTVITHFNHPIELTEIVYKKVKMLKSAGITILNQSVLLKNINDSIQTIEELNLKLLKNGIIPYYLHHSDEVKGTSHFRTSLETGLNIMKALQGRNPGISLPKYVVDLPKGGGKVPVQNSYLIKYQKEKKQYSFYNYEWDSNKIFYLKEIYD
ncbi:MAG: KamA family radical SAM protein [Leptonema sp. (in: bacteria)]